VPWTVIVNPAAGRGRTQKLLPELERTAKAAGVDFHVSPEPGAPTKLARAAVDDGHDLVACGGDGLVTEVAGVAADTGRRLAVVPTGAGNDFARVLGYDPKHPLRAFAALEDGRDRVVDLGRVNGRWYTCVTASGFDAEANRWANTVRRLSGTTLYVAAVLRTLAVYKPHRFRVTVDGETTETRAWLVAVGNGPAYAGGMHVTPNAKLDDGLLDVTIIRPVSRMTLLALFPKLSKGTHVPHPQIEQLRGRTVRLESPGITAYADGEPLRPLPVDIEIAPAALTVLA